MLRVFALASTSLMLLALPAHADDAGWQDKAWQTGRFEVGPRLTHLTIRDVDTDAELPMGGLGAYVRYRISRRWGVEGAVDAVMADQLADSAPGDVVRVTAPATLSALFYLWPDNTTQFYLLAGVGGADHEVEYSALGEVHTWSTPVSTFGFGIQFRTESIRYDLSLRALSFHAEDDDRAVTRLETGRTRAVRYRPHDAPRTLTGGMFNLGVNWGW